MIKFQGTNRSGEEGEEPALSDPGSESRLGGRKKKRSAKVINRMKIYIKYKQIPYIHTHTGERVDDCSIDFY